VHLVDAYITTPAVQLVLNDSERARGIDLIDSTADMIGLEYTTNLQIKLSGIVDLLGVFFATTPTQTSRAHPTSKQDERFAHGTLDGQTAYILPSLFQQTDQEIDCKHDIGNQLIIRHGHIANRNTKTEHLL